MAMPAEDAYWQIGSDTTRFWSTAQKAYVAPNDVGLLAWLAKGNAVLPALTEAALSDTLTSIGLGALAPILPPAVVRAQTFTALADRADLIARLQTATPAQIDSWLTANVTNLVQARAVLAAIIKVLAAYPPN